MTDDLQPWYHWLAPAPNTTYGSVLPFAIDDETQKMRWAMPDSVRSGLKGVLDLANSTQTGSLTGDALASVTMGSVGAGLGLAPRGALAAGAAKPIRAYHGSPHDFDRFDLSKIGTGEGAQAYGHGLYFAGNEDVAKSYKKAGDYATREVDVINGQLSRLAREMDQFRGSQYGQYTDPKGYDLRAQYDALMAKRSDLGHMYEVNIHADPAKMLDWDKPLSGQPGIVQDLARNADLSHLKPGNRTRVMLENFKGGAEQPHYPATGHTLHNALSDYGANGNPALSQYLKDQGIPGVRYLDGGSRNAGQGSHNYVMFDDKNIEILRKYGMMAPAPVAPPGLRAPQQQPVQQPGFRVAKDMVY